MDEVLISSEFDFNSCKECMEFLESLRAELLQEISNINHIIEWMKYEDQECGNKQLTNEQPVKELHLLEKASPSILGAALAILL